MGLIKKNRLVLNHVSPRGRGGLKMPKKNTNMIINGELLTPIIQYRQKQPTFLMQIANAFSSNSISNRVKQQTETRVMRPETIKDDEINKRRLHVIARFLANQRNVFISYHYPFPIKISRNWGKVTLFNNNL